jgi:hypothetical protein
MPEKHEAHRSTPYFWQLDVIVSGERPTFPVRHVSPAAHGSFVFGLHA